MNPQQKGEIVEEIDEDADEFDRMVEKMLWAYKKEKGLLD